MKYKIVVGQGISTTADSGMELDLRVQEALAWGTFPSDIHIEIVVEGNNYVAESRSHKA